MQCKIHHIGYAVPDLEKALKEFSSLGWEAYGEKVDDESRRVRIAFMEKDSYRVELVAPMSSESPVRKMLAKGSGAPYHICYQVEDLASAEAELKAQGFIVFKKAAVAPAIQGGGGQAFVEFMYSKQNGIIELVEVKKI